MATPCFLATGCDSLQHMAYMEKRIADANKDLEEAASFAKRVRSMHVCLNRSPRIWQGLGWAGDAVLAVLALALRGGGAV